MLTPLKQYICDTCGELIEKPEDGMVEWLDDTSSHTGQDGLINRKHDYHSFNIVHHASKSPFNKGNPRSSNCYQHGGKSGRRDVHLHQFIEPDYLYVKLAGFLDYGEIIDEEYLACPIRDIREYAEFQRRLTVPNYEEARQYFGVARENGHFDGFSETAIFGQFLLKEIIKEYSEF